MRPVLFHLGPFAVGSHGFFVALGLLVGLAFFASEVRRRQAWDDRLLVVLAGLLVGGALGARLAGVLDAATRDGAGAAALAWQYGGRSILGGLSGAYLGAVIGKRLADYPHRTGDLFAPAVAAALAVGRFGCLLSEAPGRPTSLPWGVSVAADLAPGIPRCPGCLAGVPMHPSFLYESIFCLLAVVLLLWLRDRIDAPGELLVVFLAGYASFRFLVEFTRANEVIAVGLTRSQLFLLATAPLLAWRVGQGARRGHYRGLRHKRPNRAAAATAPEVTA